MITKLGPEAIFKPCDPSIFPFDTTEVMEKYEGTMGQDRAIRALDFGLTMDSTGFNIFALGETGTGRMTAVMTLLKERALKEKAPDDWCYVNNFKDTDVPLAVSLPAGKGVQFQREMAELIRILQQEIPKAFESKEYEVQKGKILEEFQQKQNEYFSRLDAEAKTHDFTIRKSPTGIMIVPLKENGELLSKEEYDALDEAERKRLEEIGRSFQEKLNDIARVLRDAEKLVKDMVTKLDRVIVHEILDPMIDGMKSKYAAIQKIVDYLDNVGEEVLTHIDDFRGSAEETPSPLPFLKMPKPEANLGKYAVNVVVNNMDQEGAPVVFESNPTYLNLFGRIEYRVLYGMASTDFAMIKAGSVHKANGGYLVINAMDLFKNVFSYDALKRALKNREIKIEDIMEQFRLMSTTGLKPEAIPLNVKVIIVGSPYIYYLLYNYDEESRDLFKVKADFDSRMERTPENIRKYAAYITSCQREENLLPVDRTGIAKIVEYGSRFADHQEKLSTRFSVIGDLLREAHYWAKKDASSVIKASHVTRAVSEKVFRVNRIEERMQEMMLEDTIIVETGGLKVGQVNGLAVLDLGDYRFGKPSRITAKTYTGKAGIVNIERETKMSGKIHEKAVLIITSYLGSKYALKRPISLSAWITFEQLYEGVEGDSATCAELYALLSSIAGVPLRQCYAVTGSMDQNGEVQPIGGVNEKIEGFFDLCKARGLDGSHGVIIPRRNAKNLVLKEELVGAVREGKFSIYTIEKMEEGLEILAGMAAGDLRPDGTYPEESINFLIEKRLTEIAEAMEKKKNGDEEREQKKEDDCRCTCG